MILCVFRKHYFIRVVIYIIINTNIINCRYSHYHVEKLIFEISVNILEMLMAISIVWRSFKSCRCGKVSDQREVDLTVCTEDNTLLQVMVGIHTPRELEDRKKKIENLKYDSGETWGSKISVVLTFSTSVFLCS